MNRHTEGLERAAEEDVINQEVVEELRAKLAETTARVGRKRVPLSGTARKLLADFLFGYADNESDKGARDFSAEIEEFAVYIGGRAPLDPETVLPDKAFWFSPTECHMIYESHSWYESKLDYLEDDPDHDFNTALMLAHCKRELDVLYALIL